MTEIQLSAKKIERLESAVKSKASVNGLTHNFYKYPARFSPKFAREVIELFSKPGDVILDPFVGGGTTLVEAAINSRHVVGFDVSPIATFVSGVKTTVLSKADIQKIKDWVIAVVAKSSRGYSANRNFYDTEGYLNNVPWQLRNTIEIMLNDLGLLANKKQINFVKCVILNTAQWAIDCKKRVPSSKEFRKKILLNLNVAIKGAEEFSAARSKNKTKYSCIFFNDSSENISSYKELKNLSKPKLVVTSPPYIGVHILYHQWQVNSRKRTRAPFWIINSLDGQGSAFYTFGHYKSHAKKTYFEIAEKVFKGIYNEIHDEAIVVQLVGFSDHNKYLKKYIKMMDLAGYEEIALKVDSLDRIKRIWRNVPNRKWYVSSKNQISSGKEVLLIHKKK